MKFYRDWHLSGDDSFLKNDWVQVKKAISYAWIKGGWDGNQDGVMEGSQHNTMDVNYFGPNPQMQFWYFGALTPHILLSLQVFLQILYSHPIRHLQALNR